MRSSQQAHSFRVAVLASGLAILSAACGSSSGTPNAGTGGKTGDAGTDTKSDAKVDTGTGAGGAGGKTDSGTGTGGKMDSGTDTGTGGMAVDSGTDTGTQLNPPWRAYLPLVTTGPGSTAAMGTSLDLSPNHYDATYYGSTVSFANGSVNLTGVNTELVVVQPKSGVPAVDVTGSYSVQAWVNMTDVTGFQTFLSGEGFNIASFFLQKRADNGGAFAFTTQAGDSVSSGNCISPPTAPIDGGPTPSPVVAVVNTLYHLVATRDGTTGTQILYVNGVESGRNTCPAGFVDTGILGIGHGVFLAARGDFVHGAISDVGVINRVLTPAEVTDLFNRGRTFVPPPPPDAGPDVAPDAGTDTAPDAPADVPTATDGSADGG
jgi:hypothetical protein